MSAKAATLDKNNREPATPRARRGLGGRFARSDAERAAETPAAPPQPQAEPEPEAEAEPAAEVDDNARYVGALKVIDVEPVYTGLKPRPGKPRISLKNTVILVLEDGSKVFSCTECTFTDAGRGTVMRHRAETHGQNLGGWHNRKTKGTDVTGITAASKPAMGMSLGEVLELGSKLEAYAVVMERQEERIAELRERAEVAERRLRAIAYKLEKAGLQWISED